MLGLAGWIRYLRGYDLKGCTIRIDDPDKELLTRLATTGGNNPEPVMRHDIFGEFRMIPGFTDRLRAMITDIDERGVIRTLRQVLGDNERELVLQ
jgi:mannitol 2-dehydrogenase